MRKIITTFDKIKFLMDTGFELEKLTNTKFVSNKLFDNLCDKAELQFELFDYIYEQVKFYMFEKVPVISQAKEFQRLVLISDLKSEFSDNLGQWIKVYNS